MSSAAISRNSLGADVEFIVVDFDPRGTSIDCEAGSLIVYLDPSPFGRPIYYYKLTSGDNADVLQIIVRNNFTASTPPSASDDIGQGFSEGSNWYDGTNVYICVNATAGAAVWIKINS